MEEPVVNLTYLRDLAGGDTKFMTDMIALFLKQTPANMHLLTGYLEQQNWENLKKLAHKMTSGVALMGIQELQNFLAELQTYTLQPINVELIPIKIAAIMAIYQKAVLELEKELFALAQLDCS
ncbi:Hpt domain-containing protein [Adhaeribacter swui]|uniref:Hpt domain-containing protein n=1 Tax=Adhaeribacter swui TaxID=2086471 RepID=A0A7G7GAL4_9BACT|nr:Hpt domain-containing protein [Adhaeribacter swui]QNF34198.1 Hpt domain-containing protein [Adhaeribacter swui]